MKHEHKLIALLLCLAMLLGLLAGCGSSQSAASEADAEASDAGDAVASAEEPPEDTPEAVQDEGSASELAEAAVEGSEVEEAAEIQEDDELFTWGKISFHPTEIPLPLTDEDVTLSLWTDFLPPLFAAMNGMEDNSVYIELEKRTGVDLDITANIDQRYVSEGEQRMDLYRRMAAIRSDRDAEVESLSLGAIDFISKPYPMPSVILARVLRTIELSEDRDIIGQTERDQLTGLYNRRGFAEHLPDMLTEMRSKSQTPALLLVTWQKSGGLLPFDPLLALSNAVSRIVSDSAYSVRIDESVLAVLYAENVIRADTLIDKIDNAMKSLLGKMSGTIRLVTNSICISDYSLRESETAVIQAAAALREQAETSGIDLNAAIRRLRQDIFENPQKDWNTTDIAARLCISKSHLYRLYKQISGLNLMDDVIEARIAKARQLLEFSDLRIQEIALQCGYNNESHFMRQFKKNNGVTPTVFRREHRT